MALSTSSRQRNVEEDAFNGIGDQSKRIKFSQSPKFFDVFINHRGPDAKQTLARHLYNSLENLGIRAFLDSEEIELGDFFPSTIQDAIFSASVQIAIFSKRYAESPWCLAELTLMLQTKTKIIPIFYDVAPSDLRYIEEGVYAHAFTAHKERGKHLNKLDSWKETLHSVSFISGYNFCDHNRNVEKLCKKVVSAVLREVEKTRVLETAKYPVGINNLVEDFERHCDNQIQRKYKIIGIYGMGGSGKTTLAKELFTRKRSEYRASCFLFDVREASANGNLTSLQSKLLKDLTHEDRKFYSIPEGSSYLRSRLGRGPFVNFLIILDDIDHEHQLDAFLVIDIVQNNSSSLIIVTTRDERILIRAGITHRYKMKKMNDSRSTELFCWNAFHQPYPTRGYEGLVEKFVKECGGLPLSLQVLGGHVFGSAGKHYWKLELDKVKKALPQDIMERLRISFDALDTEQKQIFMDIACFFINKSKHMAIRIWEESGWSPEHTLQTLQDKCLVEVEVGKTYWNGFDSENIPVLKMHDHIRDLGRKIADEVSSPRRLWRPQYLRAQEAKGFQNILAESCGHSFRCLNSIFDQHTTFEFRYFLGNSNDCHDTSTSLLWLELDLSLLEKLAEPGSPEAEHMTRVPLPCTIPSWIPLQSLQYLKISNGHLRRLWQGDLQAPFHLKELVLEGTNLEEFPNSIGMLSHLEDLVLTGRTEWNGSEWNSPMQIDGRSFSESLRKLPNLRSLVLRDLTLSGELNLNGRKVSTPMVSLEKIDIRDVKLASKVSISGEYIRSLKSLHLESMESLIEVDLGLLPWVKLAKDVKLNRERCSEVEEGCSEVVELSSPSCLSCLERITIDGCWRLQKIKGIEKFEGLKYLHLSASTGPIFQWTGLMQRVPSQGTCLIWRATPQAESNLDTDSFSYMIGRCGTVTEIPSDPKVKIVVPLKTQPSVFIITMLIEISHQRTDFVQNIKIPSMDWTPCYIPEGEWMVTVVITEKEKIKKMRDEMCDWIPSVSEGIVKRGLIITIDEGKEKKTLWALQKIVNGRWKTEDGRRLELDPSTSFLWLDLSLFEKLDELGSLEGEQMTSVPLPCTIPSWIPLQSLQYLRISNGHLRRLWQGDGQIPFQLKELVLEGANLEEFPNSLGMLSHLEDLVLTGRATWNCPMRIDGRSLSEFLIQLTNLRSLVLRDLILSGGLNLKGGKVSTTTGTPMVSLEKIDIRNVIYASKVSITGEYFRSLKSLHLESMASLIEVDLGLVPCVKLAKDIKLNRERCLEVEEGCSEVVELSSLPCLSCLERITIDGCWWLQKIKGIEKFEGLKYLHLSVSTKAICECIGLLQRVPSHVTILIWTASPQAESNLDRDNFSHMIGPGGTVTEIPSDPKAKILLPLKRQPTAIIISMLFIRGYGFGKNLKIPAMEWMASYIAGGKWMVTVVITDKEKIKEMGDEMRDWIPSVSEGIVKRGLIITIDKGDEKVLLALKKIVGRNLAVQERSQSCWE